VENARGGGEGRERIISSLAGIVISFAALDDFDVWKFKNGTDRFVESESCRFVIYASPMGDPQRRQKDESRTQKWKKPELNKAEKKKAERTRPNDYICERNKAELINLITEYRRIHSRNKAERGVY